MKTTDPSLDIVRQFFLEENPNPERVGCPPEETLKAAAENRLPVSDPARLHMAGLFGVLRRVPRIQAGLGEKAGYEAPLYWMGRGCGAADWSCWRGICSSPSLRPERGSAADCHQHRTAWRLSGARGDNAGFTYNKATRSSKADPARAEAAQTFSSRYPADRQAAYRHAPYQTNESSSGHGSQRLGVSSS